MVAWLILLLLLVSVALAQTQAQDCAVFEALYTQSQKSIPWTRGSCCNLTAGFPTSQPSFSCSGGRVTGARLEWGAGLNGSIPDLSGLTELERLDIGVNNLSGDIPPLSALAKLRVLNLGSNKLSGTIPALRKLTNLEELYLDNNQLRGQIPQGISLLSRLRVLSLDNNQLRGALDDLQLPTSITSCFLGNNTNFYTCGGFIPAACGLFDTNKTACRLTQTQDCAPFETLYTQSEKTIPWTRGSCCNLTAGFPSSGPSFNCSGVRVVGAKFQWGDGIKGTIPDLSQLTELEYLDLGLQQLSGPVPPLDALTKLRVINLGSNSLTGGFPPTIVGLANLERLFIDRNQLTGPVPSLANLSNLYELSAARNDFSGNFDDILPPTIRTCDISSNPSLYTCGGTIPSACGRLPQNNSACAASAAAVSTTGTSTQGVPKSTGTASPDAPSGSSSNSSSVGPIAGGVVGGVAGVLAIAGIAFWIVRKKTMPNAAGGGKAAPAPNGGISTMASISTARSPPVIPRFGDSGLTRTASETTATSLGSNGTPPLPAFHSNELPIGASTTPTLPPLSSFTSQTNLVSPHDITSGVTVAYRSFSVGDIPSERLSGPGLDSAQVAAGPYHQLSSEVRGRTMGAGNTLTGGSTEAVVGSQVGPAHPSHWAFTYLAGPSFESLPALNLPPRMRVFTIDYEYTPTTPDEIAVSAGDSFKLRTIFCDGWGYGTNVDTDETGMIPLDCLRITPSQPLFSGRHSVRLQSRQGPSSSIQGLPPGGSSGDSSAIGSSPHGPSV